MATEEAPGETRLNPRWIEFVSVIGSRAYGLAHEGSDWDLRGWYLPPIEQSLSLRNYPEQIGPWPGKDEVYYEVKKLVRLALKGNPSSLEILWGPQVRQVTPLGQELLDIRSGFLSQRLRNTHLGYAAEQFNKMTNHPKMPWKHAMHLLRVLMAGTAAFETGEVMVEITDPDMRRTLQQVRAGEVSRSDFDDLHHDLRGKFDRAVALELLPKEPDFDTANQFLLRARYHAWNTGRN